MRIRRVKTTADEARNRKRICISLDGDLHTFGQAHAEKLGTTFSGLLDRLLLREQMLETSLIKEADMTTGEAVRLVTDLCERIGACDEKLARLEALASEDAKP